ncbi:MAG: hypothetical protein M0Z95_18020, partial [Actinomycetota bacterium]|nr:hypothetical protein [Actinomycetota bacterium]
MREAEVEQSPMSGDVHRPHVLYCIPFPSRELWVVSSLFNYFPQLGGGRPAPRSRDGAFVIALKVTSCNVDQ